MTDIHLSDIPFARPTPATLATVKHGGCVQLGDGLLPCPFCGERAEGIDFGPGSGDNEGGSRVACTGCQSSGPVEFGYKENFISNLNRRALTAQPSPRGQVDAWAIKLARESAFAHSNEHAYLPQTREEVNRWPPHEWVIAAIQAAALAARQQVGEPVAWMTHHDEPMLFPTAAEAAAYCEDDERPAPLFRSPAQAVDLGQIIEQIAQQWDGCSYDAVGEIIDVGRAIRAAGKRLIDSQAAGNG